MTTEHVSVPRKVYENLAQIAEGKMSKHNMQDLAAEAYNILSRATPSAPRVVTADVVDRITEVLRHHRLTHSQDDDGEGYPLIDALSIGHKTVKEGIEEIEYLADAIAGELSFATSPPAARVPDGFIELLARAEDVANVDWTHMESGSWQKMRGLRTAIGMAKMSMFAAAPQAGES